MSEHARFGKYQWKHFIRKELGKKRKKPVGSVEFKVKNIVYFIMCEFCVMSLFYK